jgi:hypothetical protein
VEEARLDEEHLELKALRARVRHLSAELGLAFEETGSEDGFQALLSAEDGEEEVFVAVGVAGGGYVSLSLLLVVDESFFREEVERILEVTSRFDVSPTLIRDPRLEEGEIYLSLSLRIFLDGLGREVYHLALENLREARAALAEAF